MKQGHGSSNIAHLAEALQVNEPFQRNHVISKSPANQQRDSQTEKAPYFTLRQESKPHTGREQALCLDQLALKWK